MDGNAMVDKCRSLSSGVAPKGDTALLNTGECAGYVAGVTDAEAMWKAIDDGKARTKAYDHYCRPEEVNNG